jgi:PKD repeat protein
MKRIPFFLIALCTIALLVCAASASVVSIGNGEVTTIGANATVDLVLDEAPAGLAGYSINISFANPNIARVSAVSYPGWAALTDTSALPSSDCRVKATDTGEQVQAGAANITLATVTIEGIAGGTTSVNLVVNMMNDDNDAIMSPATTGGTFFTNVPVPPTVAFTANISSGVTPLAVQFTDQSTGIPTSWSWDFGDGGTSTEQNPVHVYTTAGTYTVSLTATNAYGSGLEEKAALVTVSPSFGTIVREWTFESGTEEGFTPVSTWGSGMTLSVSPSAHGGAYALQCYANNGIGYAKAPLLVPPDSRNFLIEYWIRSSNIGYGYTSVGMTVVDASGGKIAEIGGNDDWRDTDGTVFINPRVPGVWVRHMITWNKDTGVIDHFVYDANGVLLGSRTITRAATVGKVPAAVWCNVRGYTVAHTIQYDDIAFSRAMTPPVAAFTSDIQAGISPLTVQFSDQSTNAPTAWAWDFGDGATSTEQNPSHQYTAVGTYTVKLTATNADGSDVEEKTGYIQALDPSQPTVLITPQVRNVTIGTTRDFSLSMTSLPSGIAGYNLSVSLSDPGAGEITAITLPAWASLNLSSGVPGDSVWASGLDLARNVEAGATNVPLGTVTVRGDVIGSSPFVVTVHEMDADGGGLISPVVVSGVLNVYQPVPLSADFSADNTTGYFPLTVRFTDLSTGIPAPSAWTWSFGDGSANSTARNPIHTYQPGQYTVTLTVSNDLEQVTVMKANYITVTRHVVTFPGCSNPPLDPDLDGRYEDINGNGRLDFHDVVTLYQNMQWVRDNTEVGVEPFDFNGNGRLDYDDVVHLYYEVLAG